MTTTTDPLTAPCLHGWTPTPGKRGDYCRQCRTRPPAGTGRPETNGATRTDVPATVEAPDAFRTYLQTIGGRSVHPLADLLPAMPADEYRRLKEDIAVHGLHLPVLTKDGLILDGRHRAQACAELGVVYETRDVGATDPATIVASLNLHRRHLQPDQVVAIAELLRAEMPGHHVMRGTSRRVGKQAAEDAKTLGVGQATVERVREVKRKAPERLRDVAAGRTSAVQVLREAKPKPPGVAKTPSKVDNVHVERGTTTSRATADPRPGLDCAVVTLQQFSGRKLLLLKELRRTLHDAQVRYQRWPTVREPLREFYQSLGRAFEDGSIEKKKKAR